MKQPPIQTVPIKVYRSDDRVSIAAPMPGLEPQDLEVSLTVDGRLTIFGEMRGAPKGLKQVLVDEWNPGPYERTIEIPSQVDASIANASYENGVLVVTLPVSPTTRPARFGLDRISATEGRRVGHAGNPPRPTAV
jgi:HSP20 family protein